MKGNTAPTSSTSNTSSRRATPGRRCRRSDCLRLPEVEIHHQPALETVDQHEVGQAVATDVCDADKIGFDVAVWQLLRVVERAVGAAVENRDPAKVGLDH